MSRIKNKSAIKHVTTVLIIPVIATGINFGIYFFLMLNRISANLLKTYLIVTIPILTIITISSLFKLHVDAVHYGQQEKEII